MGGDEFLMVLTHIQEDKMQMALERLRARFASKKFAFGGESILVTASFGACGFHGKNPPEFSNLVRQADEALYCAKRACRHQIKIELFPVAGPSFREVRSLWRQCSNWDISGPACGHSFKACGA